MCSPSVVVCVPCNVAHDVVHPRSEWTHITMFVLVSSTWGQCQVQQWTKLEMLVARTQPVSVDHVASGSDSDTPINHCNVPGNLQ